MSRMPSSFVAPQTPAWVVTGSPSSRATSKAAFSGNAGSPVTSKASCTPRRSSRRAGREEPLDLRLGGPLPRPGLDVPVREHEPTGRTAQPVDSRFRVVDALEAVGPVDDRGHARVDRLPGGKQVARAHVLGPEPAAVLEVVPDEVLGERPVRSVTAHSRLPHVPVRVDHAGHDDPAGRVDLEGTFGSGETGTDLRDAIPDDEDVGVGQHRWVSSMVRTVPCRNTTADGVEAWSTAPPRVGDVWGKDVCGRSSALRTPCQDSS